MGPWGVKEWSGAPEHLAHMAELPIAPPCDNWTGGPLARRAANAIEHAEHHRGEASRCSAKRTGASIDELAGRAVAPRHAHGGDAIAGSCGHVELAIADHHRALGHHTFFRNEVGDEVALMVIGAIELGPVNAGEAVGEIETLQDRPRVVMRLGGGDEQPAPGG